MYVVLIKSSGQYIAVGATWRKPVTSDLQKARTFTRTADARNAANSYYRKIDGDVEVLPVTLALA